VATDEETGEHTITCEDGSSASVSDGSSCSVADNSDGTFTITCEDGTEVTISNGQDAGPVLLRTDPIPFLTPPCVFGGRTIVVGNDSNDDGELQLAEETGSTFICNLF
jgi:hypothetical protein